MRRTRLLMMLGVDGQVDRPAGVQQAVYAVEQRVVDNQQRHNFAQEPRGGGRSSGQATAWVERVVQRDWQEVRRHDREVRGPRERVLWLHLMHAGGKESVGLEGRCNDGQIGKVASRRGCWGAGLAGRGNRV